MAHLKVVFKQADPNLVADGEVRLASDSFDVPPRVSHVQLGLAAPSFFELAPGEYIYYFHVDGAGGAFEVALVEVESEQELASKGFDTKFGYSKRLPFKVG